MSPVAGGTLLEREHELTALRAGLDRACAGEGGFLLVEGPPGVGKTERCARPGQSPAGLN